MNMSLYAKVLELERRIEQQEQRLADAASRLAGAEGVLRALPPRPSQPMAEAKAFLTETLAAGPRRAIEVLALARERGIAERTLRRAKAALGFTSFRVRKEPGRPAASWWRLPA